MRESQRCLRQGLTLVEVVIGLALMGTLLASAIVATGKHLQQIENAKRNHEAIIYLDQYLNQWSLSGFDRKRVPESTTKMFRIRSEFVLGRGSERVHCAALRIEVIDRRKNRVACWVEILVPQTQQ